MAPDDAANLPVIQWPPAQAVVRVETMPTRQLEALGRALLDQEAAELHPHDLYLQTTHVLGYDALRAGSVWNSPP